MFKLHGHCPCYSAGPNLQMKQFKYIVFYLLSFLILLPFFFLVVISLWSLLVTEGHLMGSNGFYRNLLANKGPNLCMFSCTFAQSQRKRFGRLFLETHSVSLAAFSIYWIDFWLKNRPFCGKIRFSKSGPLQVPELKRCLIVRSNRFVSTIDALIETWLIVTLLNAKNAGPVPRWFREPQARQLGSHGDSSWFQTAFQAAICIRFN